MASLRARGRGTASSWAGSRVPGDRGRREAGGRHSDCSPRWLSPARCSKAVWRESRVLPAARSPAGPELARSPSRATPLFEAANQLRAAPLGRLTSATRRARRPGAGQAKPGRLSGRLAEARQQRQGLPALPSAGVVALLARVAWLKTDDPAYRAIIVQARLLRSVRTRVCRSRRRGASYSLKTGRPRCRVGCCSKWSE